VLNKGKKSSLDPHVEEEPEIVTREAERFDFTFQDVYYALYFKIDEYGERITSTSETMMGRIISKNGICRPEESMFDEEILDEFGNVVNLDKPVVPIEELKSVYYF